MRRTALKLEWRLKEDSGIDLAVAEADLSVVLRFSREFFKRDDFEILKRGLYFRDGWMDVL